MGREGLEGKIKAMSIIKRKEWKIASAGEDVEKSDPLCIAVGNVKHSAAVENSLAVPHEVNT